MNPTFLLKLHILTGLWFNPNNSYDVKFSWTDDEHHAKAVAVAEELEKAELIVIHALDHAMGTMRGNLTALGREYVIAISTMSTIVKVLS